ncbi:MAG: hypothetical protein ABR958_06360 [Dehalococcoidales bacterium]|jgi:hypothetical protein
MAIDGTYKIEINSPMGLLEVKLNFKVSGAILNGSSDSSFGKSTFTGKVNGDEVSWDSEVNGPMGKMQFSFKGKIKGNDFSGEVNTGMFGTYPFKGKRV